MNNPLRLARHYLVALLLTSYRSHIIKIKHDFDPQNSQYNFKGAGYISRESLLLRLVHGRRFIIYQNATVLFETNLLPFTIVARCVTVARRASNNASCNDISLFTRSVKCTTELWRIDIVNPHLQESPVKKLHAFSILITYFKLL